MIENEFRFTGYLSEKPKLEKTRTGVSTCEFAVSTPTRKKDDNGRYIRKFHNNIVAYGQIAESMASHNGKGDLVVVAGWIDEQSWKNDRGENRYKTVYMVEQYRTLKWADKEGMAAGGEMPAEDELPF